MPEKMRPTFLCWKCQRQFHQTLQIGEADRLLVECPYCGAEAAVDLGPYRSRIDEILRGTGERSAGTALGLPEVISTQTRD